MVPNAACGKPVVPTAPIPQPSAYKTPFVLSFEPFKAEKKLISEWAEKKQMEHWQNFGCVDETDIWTRGNYRVWLSFWTFRHECAKNRLPEFDLMLEV